MTRDEPATDDSDAVAEPIRLSERDWATFVAALENPPEPNAELKRLMREFGPWAPGGPAVDPA